MDMCVRSCKVTRYDKMKLRFLQTALSLLPENLSTCHVPPLHVSVVQPYFARETKKRPSQIHMCPALCMTVTGMPSCAVFAQSSGTGWEVPPLEVEMFDALNANGSK